MDRAAPSIESMNGLELRVSAGPQSGARNPLEVGEACVIAAGADGQAAECDILLRDDKAAPVLVRLNADLPVARIEVLQGQVKLGNQVIDAGQQADWPAHAPLAIGSAVVAFGLACIDTWPDAAASNEKGAQPKPEPVRNRAVKETPWRRRADVWLATTGAGVLLLCGAVVAVAYHQAGEARSPAGTSSADPIAELSRSLRASEFQTLDVTTRGNQQAVIRGRLETEAQRDKLAQWLLNKPLAPAVEVTVDEALLREVTEIFRVNGVAVSAQVAGPGRIAAEAAERDAGLLARAEEAVRRDVRGLEALSVRNVAKPALPPAVPPPADDPAKRIASLVAGASAYLVTVDGARYFVGAMLPTGHRIVGIDRTVVALERDGQKTSLNF